MRVTTVAGHLTDRPLSSTSLAELICDRVNAVVPATRAITVDITGNALMHWFTALPTDVRLQVAHLKILDVGETMTMVAELNQLTVVLDEPRNDERTSRLGDRIVIIVASIMVVIVIAILAFYILTSQGHAAILPHTVRDVSTLAAYTETVA